MNKVFLGDKYFYGNTLPMYPDFGIEGCAAIQIIYSSSNKQQREISRGQEYTIQVAFADVLFLRTNGM